MRFLLADDPGAGKTIMAGLLVKELIIRGDIARCLIVAIGMRERLQRRRRDECSRRYTLIGN